MENLELVKGKVDWKGRPAVRYKHGGMKTAVLILATFSFENMATNALLVNLVTYFNGVMHFELADAANQITNYMGTAFLLSNFMAILADTFFGRFKILIISGCIEFVGLALMTVQAHYPKLRPPVCSLFDPTAKCEQVEGGSAALLFIALYMIAIGGAGFKAALPSHGADQFDESDPREERQMSSFFNFLLVAVSLGSVIGLTLFVWVQHNKGFDWGFGLSTTAMFLGVVIFLAGLPLHRIQIFRETSPIVEIIQVYVAAIRNRNLSLPEDPAELYEISKDKEAALELEFLPHRPIFRFLDKASVERGQVDEQHPPNPWKLCRVTQVENAKIILGLVPIFCTTIIMALCLAQLQTFSIQQGLTMDTSITKNIKFPPPSLAVIPIVFLIIIVPFYDRVIVPIASKFTGIPSGITHLQRIGVGLVLSFICMAVSAIIEVKRKDVARDHNMLLARPMLQPLPISVFWLSFQFFIFGIADMFTYVGLLEFFYSEAPKGLKSISVCFVWTSMALGYFFSTIVIKIVNNATKGGTRSGGWLAGNNINLNHLDRFYWLLSFMSLINFFIYLFVAKRYKYRLRSPMLVSKENKKEIEVNEL